MVRQPPRATRPGNSFPTRRSSDLVSLRPPLRWIESRKLVTAVVWKRFGLARPGQSTLSVTPGLKNPLRLWLKCPPPWPIFDWLSTGIERSEEHTSELQSLMRISYAAFCLKKKNKKNNTHMH